MEAAGVFLSGDGSRDCSCRSRGESLFGRLLDVLPHGARVRRAAADGKAIRQRVAAFSDARVGHRARLVFSYKMVLLIFRSAVGSHESRLLGATALGAGVPLRC